MPPDADAAVIGAASVPEQPVLEVESPRVRRRLSWKLVLFSTILAIGYSSYVAVGAWLGLAYVAPTMVRAEVAGAEATPPWRGIIASGFPPLFPDQMSELAPIIPLPEWQGRERINVLLMGVDQREE